MKERNEATTKENALSNSTTEPAPQLRSVCLLESLSYYEKEKSKPRYYCVFNKAGRPAMDGTLPL